MSSYNVEYNTDATSIRFIIVALLQELRDKIYFYNVIEDNSYKKINVPFYYAMTGQERFLLDTFLFKAEENDKAVGSYEVVPRGVIKLDSISIDSDSLVNKYVRTKFIREIDKQLKTFSLETQLIPVKISFSTEIVVNNNLEMFKVTESLITTLYKNNSFYVDFGGYQTRSVYNMPEDLAQEKRFEYGFIDKKEYKVTFNIEVTSQIAVFEGDIKLQEIPFIVDNTPGKSIGIGVYRNGGIYFGNVMEEIHLTGYNLSFAPIQGIVSNQGYNATGDVDNLETKPYFQTIVKSDNPDEDRASKLHRNVNDTNTDLHNLQ